MTTKIGFPMTKQLAMKGTLTLAGMLMAIPLLANTESPNPVRNSDFEQITDGQAPGWSFDPNTNGIFKVNFEKVAGRGGVIQITANNAGISFYVSQEVAIKPNTNYRLSALTRVSQGTSLMYVHGVAERNLTELGRCYTMAAKSHPLAPWFWKKSWIQGNANQPEPWRGTYWNFVAEPNQWQPVYMEFNSGDMKAVNVSLGAYFEAGKYAFDDIKLTEVSSQK